MQHSNKIGGSSAARIMKCPYSMTAPAHPMPDSPFALEGSYLHDVMEKILLGELEEADLPDFEGMTQELIDEKIMPALDAFDEVADFVMGHDDEADWEAYLPEAAYHFKGDLDGCFGTTDFIGIYGPVMVVLDWKFGDGVPVAAEENKQQKFYTAAAKDERPDLFNGIEKILFVIIQPRRGMECKPDIWATDLIDIETFRGDLAETLIIAEGKCPPMLSGDHCRFCPHKPLCPEINSMVSTALLAQPDAMTPEELGKAMAACATLEQYTKDIMKLGHAVLEDGGEVPGYKLVAKRANRKWTDADAVEKKLKNMKASLTDCKERPKLKSPAQVEKVLKKAGKDFSKLGDFVESKSSGNVVAPESDKRPAVETIPKQLDELADQLALR